MGLLTGAGEKQDTGDSGPDAVPEADEILTFIENFQQINPVFNCALLELPAPGSGDDNIAAIAVMIANLGLVRAMPDGNALVLLPGDADRELIVHRITTSLNLKTLFQFKEESAQSARAALATISS